MPPSSTQQRFGTAQLVALLLLFLFAAQAAYLAERMPLNRVELEVLHPPDASLREFTAQRAMLLPDPMSASPLTATVARTAAALDLSRPSFARLPFVIFGILLGASLWYIARRLYGNTGGYIALTLYSFSPTMITYAAQVQPEIAAAWGAFGCIFTSIAVAHTLYAPREVVLWNWRRILLLGIAIGIGAAAELPVVFCLVLALGFMFYLVPERRRAALIIMAAGCGVGFLVLAAVYGFHFTHLGMAVRALAGFTPSVLAQGTTWRLVALFFLRNSPGFALLLLASLVTFIVWPRARFFGNTAPLLTAAVLIVFGLLLPHSTGFSFLIIALPFVFVFVAGICTDLLETGQAALLGGIMVAALLAHAYFSLMGLARLGNR